MTFKVLIVEDEHRAARRLSDEISSTLGHKIETAIASSFVEFNEVLQSTLQDPFDVIIMDMSLPREAGDQPRPSGARECIQAMAEHEECFDTTLILWSAYAAELYLGDLPLSNLTAAIISKVEPTHRMIDLLRTVSRKTGKESELSQKVFLVHGRDEGLRDAVARVIQRLLNVEPIILAEQTNRGLESVIEKFERFANVDYAVVLMTPDDVGSLKGSDDVSERARQNVIFELGYFAARLGRERVCVLRKGNSELPSDLPIVYIDIDPAGAWKLELGRTMKAAGLNIDLNGL